MAERERIEITIPLPVKDLTDAVLRSYDFQTALRGEMGAAVAKQAAQAVTQEILGLLGEAAFRSQIRETLAAGILKGVEEAAREKGLGAVGRLSKARLIEILGPGEGA